MRQEAYICDTFQYIKELTKAGFQQKQAEVQVKLMTELVKQTLCTRGDLERTEEKLIQGMGTLELKVETTRKDLEVKIGATKKDLELKIEATKQELEVKIEATQRDLEIKIESVRKDLKIEIENVKKDLTVEIVLQITQAKHEMIKWLIATSIAGLSLMFTMIKFLL